MLKEKLNYSLITILLSVLISCKSNLTKVEFEFKSFHGIQNSLKSKNNFIEDTTMKISLIDGNSDGDFFDIADSINGFQGDYIIIADKSRWQNAGSNLKELNYVNYFGEYYLITIDTFLKTCFISNEFKDPIKFDIEFNNYLPEIPIKSLCTNTEITLKSLASNSEGLLLVKNWAPFCKPCIKEMSTIRDKMDLYNKEQFRVAYVVDTIFRSDAMSLFSQYNIENLVYVGDYEKIRKYLNFNYYPMSILFDSDGNYIQNNHLGSTFDFFKYITKND